MDNSRFKFRAWVPGRELMVEVDSVHWCGTMVRFGLREFFTASYSEIDEIPKHDNCVLMQCTGLKDKNGKLIYEGDIVIRENNPNVLIVTWFPNAAQFVFRSPQVQDKEIYFSPERMLCEIIGNIYENPELLTKE